VNLVLVLLIGGYLIMGNKSGKKAYVLNQKVFDEFAGKKELEQKLLAMKSAHKAVLDSMVTMIQKKSNDQAMVAQYQQMLQQYQQEDQDVSARYTSDIWKRINEYISTYGKEHGYDFIFGATGDGNLMYANDANDITDEVITYINARYKTGG
jgi:outer membrane protein